MWHFEILQEHAFGGQATMGFVRGQGGGKEGARRGEGGGTEGSREERAGSCGVGKESARAWGGVAHCGGVWRIAHG